MFDDKMMCSNVCSRITRAKTRLVFDDKMVCGKLFVVESLGRKPDWCLMIR